tara:strand:+ start:3014 stop:3604 length:591 start_codon:yes stop_codon:yes gene_type:complete
MKRRRIFGKKEDEDDDDKNDDIKVVNNRIYFYANVSRKNVLKLNIAIQEVRDKLKVQTNEIDADHARIYLYIQSDGGCVFSGISAMDHINRCDVPVVTIVDGYVASAATLMTIAGKERYAYPNSHMLIHQLHTEMWGRFEELRDEMENNANLQKRMREIYGKFTNIPQTLMNKIMTKEINLNADECLKYGIVDKII